MSHDAEKNKDLPKPDDATEDKGSCGQEKSTEKVAREKLESIGEAAKRNRIPLEELLKHGVEMVRVDFF